MPRLFTGLELPESVVGQMPDTLFSGATSERFRQFISKER